MMKIKIKQNDTVKVLYGKDAGKEGKVLKVFLNEGKVLVAGVNIYKKSVKGDGKNKKSEIVSIVKPMVVSKVMLVCPSCKKTTRIGIDRDKNNKKVRICKKCNKNIDIIAKEEKKETTEKETKKKETKKKETKKDIKKTKK